MPIRIGGMASGMDTDTLVKQLMQAKRIPIDKMKQQKQQLQWQQDSYREMNTLLAKLRDASDTIRFSSGINAKKATPSDPNVASATAGQAALPGTYTVNVVQVAKAAEVKTTVNKLSTDVVASTATKLTVNGVASADIDLAAGATMADLVSAVNAKTGTTGVRAFYDAGTQKVSFSSTKMGDAAKVELKLVAGGDPNLFTKMGFASDADPAVVNGKDAIITMGTDPTQIRSATNTVSVNNINITVKNTTGSPITVTVEPDVDKVYENIKKFVDTYNETIEKINAKVGEQKYRDFLPLTEEQRADMKDTEIEMWEKKAKSGMIRNDSTLKSSMDKFRTALSNPMTSAATGEYNMLSDIGISTAAPGQKTNYMDKGKLYIDETKLKEALSTNPDQVMRLMTHAGTKPDDPATPKVREDLINTGNDVGIAERMYRMLNDTVTKLGKLAGNTGDTADVSSFGLKIRDFDRRITDANSKLADYEQKYYSQFARLETAMNKAQAQQAWLASSLGGGQ